jgi:quercetin dioxygenase-like cupin family protein
MTHPLRLVAGVVLGAVLATATGTVIAGQKPNRPGGVVILEPAALQWTDYPNRPGVKLAMIEGDLAKPGPFLMRVKFPANYRLAAHTHPGIEHTTVISGALHVGYGTDDKGPSETLPAGTLILTPPNTPHFVFTTEETIVQTHGIGPWGSTPAKRP